MESSDRHQDDKSFSNSASPHDSTESTKPMENMEPTMEIDERESGSRKENVPSGRAHKGGRRLIYATREERKERNRQAQATFRERRIGYVAMLEKTILEQKDELHRLQNAYSSATDEKLNLKYKNSLLERILIEKGIDVRAELNAEVWIKPRKIPKENQPSLRRAKPPVVCRRHSSISSEPMDSSELCCCLESTSYNNFQNSSDQLSLHVTGKNPLAPPTILRWQQSHGTQPLDSPPLHNCLDVIENAVSHNLGKYPLSPAPSPRKNSLVLDSLPSLGPGSLHHPALCYASQPQCSPHRQVSRPAPTPGFAFATRPLSDVDIINGIPSVHRHRRWHRHEHRHQHVEYLAEPESNANVHMSPDAIDDADRSHSASTSNSVIHTPPADFSHVQHTPRLPFAKELEGGDDFNLRHRATAGVAVAGDLNSPHHAHDVHGATGYETMLYDPNDPFGLDASLFSI